MEGVVASPGGRGGGGAGAISRQYPLVDDLNSGLPVIKRIIVELYSPGKSALLII